VIADDDYRALLSAFPAGVAVVTARDAAGEPCGMTCSTVTGVTLSPPTLLVCLRAGSRTADAVRLRGAFAVNLLHAKARQAAEVFSSPIADRFARVCWDESWCGLPWLKDDAFALAECVVTNSVEVGDHSVLFGRVARVVRTEETAALVYGLRQFWAWDPKTGDHTAFTGTDRRRGEVAP
jgi:flavin reductase (DIM6/NTAB) family NADH-FMN oxidoreductase RutF